MVSGALHVNNQCRKHTRRPMKRQLSYVSLFIGLLLALSVFTASANDGDKLRAKLVGRQEVPVVSTGASGELELRIEDNQVSFKLSYEGIEGGNVLAAHIHLGQRNVNGGVMAFFCGGGGKPACPASAATVEGTIAPADILPLGTQQIPADGAGFPEFVSELRHGTAYANVHSTASPGGEIRGQIREDNGRHRGHDDH